MLRISAKKRNRNCTNCSEKWVQNIFVNISEISPLFYFQLSKSFRIFFNPSISERTFEIMSMIVPRWRSQMTWLLPVKFLGSAEFQPEIMVEPPLMWTKPWDLDIISKPFRNALFIILDEPACFLAHSVSEFSEGTLENFEKFEISSLHRPRYVPPAPPRNFYKSRIFSDLYKIIPKISGGGGLAQGSRGATGAYTRAPRPPQ